MFSSYGSRLATFKDQYETDGLGSRASQMTGNLQEQFYIGE